MPMIEGYMFEDHEMSRRAATACMCNLAMSKEVRAGPGSLVGQHAGRASPQLTQAPASGRRCRTCSKPRAMTG